MPKSFDLVVRHGTLVAHDRTGPADVGIRDGRIAEVGQSLAPGRNEVDATGLHVLPGLVDVHVHLREPGMTEKSTFAEGTRAAAAGGVTTVVDMPNTIPPVIDRDDFEAKAALVAERAHVDFGLYGLFRGDNIAAFPGLAEAGCMGLKLYLGKSVGGHTAPDDATILAGLEVARDAGLVVGVHAENDSLLTLYAARVRGSGRCDPASHSEARPEVAEVEAVSRIVTLAGAAHAPLHLHHVSTAAALDRVRQLRSSGLSTSVEVIMAHLSLDLSDYRRFGNLIKLNPPIRSAADVEALWAGVQNGDVDIIATDHAPHTSVEQAEPDVWAAQGGFAGVETLLPMLLEHAYRGRIGLEDIVRLCSWNPARRWSIPGKGALQPGFDADLVLVDRIAVHTIDSTSMQGRYNDTPFDGLQVHGRVLGTYLRGQQVADGRSWTGDPRGRLVRRRPPANPVHR